MPDKEEERRKQEAFYNTHVSKLASEVIAAFAAYFGKHSHLDSGGIWGQPQRQHVTFIMKSQADRAKAEANGDAAKMQAKLQELVADLNASLGDVTPVDLYHVDFVDMDAINAAGGYYAFFK